MGPFRRPSARIVLAVLLLGASAPAAAQDLAEVPARADEAVHLLCARLAEVHGTGTRETLRDLSDLDLRKGLEWEVHAAPLECGPDEWTVRVEAGGRGLDVVRGDRAADGRAQVPVKVAEDKYRDYCFYARDVLVQVLAFPAYAETFAQDLAFFVVALVGDAGADALASGLEAVRPAFATPAPPPVEPPSVAPADEAVPAAERPVQATADVDPRPWTVEDLALDSVGTVGPDASAPSPAAWEFETRNSAGPADVRAAAGPGPLVALLDTEASSVAVSSAPRDAEAEGSAAGPRGSPARPPPARAFPEAAEDPATPARAPRPPAAGESVDVTVPRGPAPGTRMDPAAAVALGGVVSSAVLGLAVALYHRMTRCEIRSSGPRARILDLVAREPGLLASGIARRLQVHRTTVEYHLRLLQAADAVVLRARSGRATYYVPEAAALRDPAPSAALVAPTARRILDLARASPGATLGEAAAAVGVDASTASRHVRRLREESLVVVRRDGRSYRLFAAA